MTAATERLAELVFVTRLRRSDMPIRDIARRLRELQAALAVIDYKITTYGGSCSP